MYDSDCIFQCSNGLSPGTKLRLTDTLLITGDGKSYPADLETFLDMEVPHDALTIGRSILLYPSDVLHYADVDADAGKWVVENLANNHKNAAHTVSHTLGAVEWFDVGWDIKNCPIKSDEVLWHGSTALFAVLIGLAMGYRRIVLAGCPMDSKGHWYFKDQTWGPRWTMESYQAWFEFAATDRARNVRSMSGYTGQLLGRPDRDFFKNGGGV